MKHLFYASIADLFKYLPQSKANPQDVAIRQKLQLASWMSLWPVAFPKYRFVPPLVNLPELRVTEHVTAP